MVIISQNRKTLVNFEHIMFIDAVLENKDWIMYAHLPNKDIGLGIFLNEDDAKEEIRGIYDAVWQGYKYHKISKLDENGKLINPKKKKK